MVTSPIVVIVVNAERGICLFTRLKAGTVPFSDCRWITTTCADLPIQSAFGRASKGGAKKLRCFIIAHSVRASAVIRKAALHRLTACD